MTRCSAQDDTYRGGGMASGSTLGQLDLTELKCQFVRMTASQVDLLLLRNLLAISIECDADSDVIQMLSLRPSSSCEHTPRTGLGDFTSSNLDFGFGRYIKDQRRLHGLGLLQVKRQLTRASGGDRNHFGFLGVTALIQDSAT